jgi:hypothetical protein
MFASIDSRRKIAWENLKSAQAAGRGVKRMRNSADLAAPGESVVRDSLQSKGGPSVARARVPGGWLVFLSRISTGQSGALFYPDPNHSWDGASLPPVPGTSDVGSP